MKRRHFLRGSIGLSASALLMANKSPLVAKVVNEFEDDEEYVPGKGYGEVYPWQGKFRADNEFQKYGVPTIWFLDAEGKILAGPFSGNVYHSDPYQISYTVKDIDEAILKYF